MYNFKEVKLEVSSNQDSEKQLLKVICEWKNQHQEMSFLEIFEMFDGGREHRSLATSAEVIETLFSGKDNTSNKIVNTIIQFVIDFEINTFETVFNMIPEVFYKELNLYALISTLNEIAEIEFFSKELTEAGFDVKISEDSVLLKIVKNYQERKTLAMTGSLLIDDNFYGSCADNLN
jgi:hypothetical protein